MVCSIFVALLLSQPPSVSPPSNTPVQRETYVRTYDDACKQAVAERKPLVVFVRTYHRPIVGVNIVYAESLKGYPRTCVVVAVPKNDWLEWRATLPASADDKAIRQAAGLEVSRPASPFVKSGLPLPRRTADAKGPWLAVSEQERLHALMPKNVSLPDLRFYRRTNHSQRIAITNDMPTIQWYRLDQHDHWGNAPTSFNPNTTKPHWSAPGGLANVDGWESHVAAYLPDAPQVDKRPLPIANGGMIPGYVWSYPVGTMFADLLTHEGRVFELRIREKNANGWDSYVAYKDTSNAPNGYHGTGKRCVECHASGPGSSEQYGIVLRGNDTVFSFSPFD